MANIRAGVLESPKISNKHMTATKDAQKLINIAKNESSVTRIALGIVKNVSGGMSRVRFIPIPAGFKFVVRSRGELQELFIYTKDKSIGELLQQRFEEG